MITEFVLTFIPPIIQQVGYIGILLLMIAESTIIPIPSEAVLPFAGYLVAQGSLNFWLTLSVATLGTVIGAEILYLIGKHFGQKFVDRFGKYFLIRDEELEKAKKLFEKHGNKIIFISRFIPAIRHVISLPAGTAQMSKKKFILYTAAGGACWNAILLIVGMQLKEHWNTLIQYSTIIDIVVIVAVIIALIWFFNKQFKKEKLLKDRNRIKNANKRGKKRKTKK